MFGSLQKRIGLRTGRRLLLAAQERAHSIQALAQPLQKVIKSLQGKGQTQRLRNGLNRSCRQQLAQQIPEQRGTDRMAWQGVGEENGEGAPATAALAAIGAEDPLAPAQAAILGRG